jgi:hypothetical protein
VIVNEMLIVEETNNVEKSEHKKCFETDMVEVALVGMEFTDSMHLLNNPNIWIGDTVASVHTLSYKNGIVRETKTNKN